LEKSATASKEETARSIDDLCGAVEDLPPAEAEEPEEKTNEKKKDGEQKEDGVQKKESVEQKMATSQEKMITSQEKMITFTIQEKMVASQENMITSQSQGGDQSSKGSSPFLMKIVDESQPSDEEWCGIFNVFYWSKDYLITEYPDIVSRKRGLACPYVFQSRLQREHILDKYRFWYWCLV
jgi:hypothetical protein